MNIYLFLFLIFFIATITGLWAIFKKAGYKGWEIIIPFYNFYIWLKIIKKPLWWYIFLLIPFINVFVVLLMIVEICKCFKKYGIGAQALGVLFPFAYMPYLGFSKKEEYLDPDKRPSIKKTALREWVDAIIFAVIAASIIRIFLIEAYTIPTSSMEKTLLVGDYLFVSKLTYGPKVPNTPLSFPFVHHTLPLTQTVKSYVEWIKLPYYRFPGIKKIKNMDVVVFNYPDGDTLSTKFQSNASYYQLVRRFGRDVVWDRQDYLNGPVILSSASPNNAHFYELQRMYGADNVFRNKDYFDEIIARPVDKRENFIKRCIGIPGDKIEIIDSKVFINGVEEKNPGKRQFKYTLSLDTMQSKIINPARLQEMDITEGYRNDGKGNYYNLTLSSESLEKIRSFGFVKSVEPEILPRGFWDPDIFPFDSAYAWNVDNFGPVWVPKKGTTIALTPENICFYRRIISVFEGNHLEEKENKIYINGQETSSYTFKMDYYWMMGDNRHNSADSRYWGFVPEDHIVGTAVFVWLSLDPNKTLFTGKIRFNKLFRIVK